MSCNRGFTLIEMLVALAIFSLAALALLRLNGATLTGSAAIEERLIGQIVARNVAVEALTDPVAPAYGVATGEEISAGRRWRWRRQTAPGPDARLQTIRIGVTGERGDNVGGLTLFRSLP